MGKNETVPARARGAAPACLVAVTTLAACSGTDPDPRAVARALGAAAPVAAAAAGPVPLRVDAPGVAAVAPWSPPAAPLVEPAPRAGRALQEEPPRPSLAIGRCANGALDAEARAALAAVARGAPEPPARGNDRDAVERLLQGQAQLALVTGKLSERDQRAGLQQTRLGVELFALAVAADVPVRSLTAAQVRKVLTGEVRSWRELGQPGGALAVLVPADAARAERAAKVLIPGDPFAASCVAVADAEVAARLRDPGALAVVRVADAPREHVRLLAIDWSAPGGDTFAYGTYPFGLAVSLVTAGEPAGDALALLQLARSPHGRALLARTLVLPD
jgi:hypothetical protein